MRPDQLRRREFIAFLGSAAAWPLAARAQQGERTRRVGVLKGLAADDSESTARLAAFPQALGQLGWTDGRNVRIDYRWAAADPDRFHTYAAELGIVRTKMNFAAVDVVRPLAKTCPLANKKGRRCGAPLVLVWLAQYMAPPPHRLDVVLAVRGLGELLAQLADENVDDLDLRLVHAAV
jgi:hypothetical protein